MATTTPNGSQPAGTAEGITKITVGGYKSISREQSIEVRPLTLLAGANSSGKSSIMQPLLLMKQTLEAPYDPGALLLNGPNVKFSASQQLLSLQSEGQQECSFSIGIQIGSHTPSTNHFCKHTDKGFDLKKVVVGGLTEITFYEGMSHAEIVSTYGSVLKAGNFTEQAVGVEFSMVRVRCFLSLALKNSTVGKAVPVTVLYHAMALGDHPHFMTTYAEPHVNEIIHLPGLRGLPSRAYPVAAIGSTFPGTFESYAASIIANWQVGGHTDKLYELKQHLTWLGLTSSISAQPLNDIQIEIRVGRMLHGASGEQDMVSIADVGFGVSQTLPVLVSLLIAKPGQLVYLEQPEIHLHPRAQVALAYVLADAAKRGVRVVAETHSSLLLLGVQTLVAEGKLPPELVKLHWFTRGEDGATTIQSADLDEGGAFGDWPEDFDDVTLNAQDRFLSAAERQLIGK